MQVMSNVTALPYDNLAEARTRSICTRNNTIHAEVDVIVDRPIRGCLPIECEEMAALIATLDTAMVVKVNKFISNCNCDKVANDIRYGICPLVA